jgi:hypothetical protein
VRGRNQTVSHVLGPKELVLPMEHLTRSSEAPLVALRGAPREGYSYCRSLNPFSQKARTISSSADDFLSSGRSWRLMITFLSYHPTGNWGNRTRSLEGEFFIGH